MPVPLQTPVIQYTASGATPTFTFPYLVPSSASLKVYLNGVLQGSGYSVSGTGNPSGGSVTFTLTPVAGTIVRLVREVSKSRSTDYTEGGALRADVLDADFDNLVMIAQDTAAIPGDLNTRLAAIEATYTVSGGNVGIGTTPTSKLHVSSTGTVANLQSTSGEVYLKLTAPSATGGYLGYGVGSTETMTFLTNSSERLRIDAVGNVGVGVAPTVKLDVFTSGAANVVASRSTTQPVFRLSDGTNNFDSYLLSNVGTLRTNTAIPIAFQTNNVERMRIDSSGNLLLGTTTSTGYKFEMTGQLGINNGTIFGGVGPGMFASAFGIGSTSNHPVVVGTNGTERMRIDAAGNLGVGTTPNGSYRLHVSSTGSNQVASQGTTDASFITNVNGTQGLYLHSTSTMSEVNELRALPLLFTVNGSERLRIDSSGNVGVGTNNPTSKFQVQITGSNPINGVTISKSTDFSSAARFGFNGLASNNDGAFFGMGAEGTGISAGIGFMREATGWNTALAFYTNNITSGPNGTSAMQEKMRIDSAGNLGIGVSTMAAKLHVQGAGSVGALAQSTGSTTGQVGWNIKNDVSNTATFSIYNSTQSAFGAVGGGDTFLYSSAPNLVICTDVAGASIKFATGTSNTERMRIDASGNVGIGGTPAGTTKFLVSGATSTGSTAAIDLNVTNTDTSTTGLIKTTGSAYSYSGVGSATTWFYGNKTVAFGTDGAYPLQFITNSTERMRIDVNGNEITKAGYADQSYFVSFVTTGFSNTIGNNIQTYGLNAAGTLASGTITMPSTPIDGQQVSVFSTQTVTSLLVRNSALVTVPSAPTTITPQAPFRLMWMSSMSQWVRI
jgi:hypothetical protein